MLEGIKTDRSCKAASYGLEVSDMFSYSVFEQGSDILLAIADKTLVGKTLKGDVDFPVSAAFYGTDECGESKAKQLLKKATIVNAVGKNIVQLLLEEKMVKKESVLTISGIPHAQVVSV